MIDFIIFSVVPNVSRMASCRISMLTEEKQRMSGMSDLLVNRLLLDCGQNRNFILSLLSSSKCAFPTELLDKVQCRRSGGCYLLKIFFNSSVSCSYQIHRVFVFARVNRDRRMFLSTVW